MALRHRAGVCCASLSLVCFGRAPVALLCSVVPWLARALRSALAHCAVLVLPGPVVCKSQRGVQHCNAPCCSAGNARALAATPRKFAPFCSARAPLCSSACMPVRKLRWWLNRARRFLVCAVTAPGSHDSTQVPLSCMLQSIWRQRDSPFWARGPYIHT